MSARSDVAALLAKSRTIEGRIDRAIGMDDDTAQAARRVVDSITGPARQDFCSGWGSLPLCNDPWCQGCDKEVVDMHPPACSSKRCWCNSDEAHHIVHVAWPTGECQERRDFDGTVIRTWPVAYFEAGPRAKLTDVDGEDG